MIAESTAVASIRPASAFAELFPAHRSTRAMMRSEMVECWMNSAKAKHDRQSTMATLTPPAQVSPGDSMPRMGTAAANSHAVIRMGMASVTHRTMAAASRPMSILPSNARPSGLGTRNVAATISTATATTPTLKEAFSLIFPLLNRDSGIFDEETLSSSPTIAPYGAFSSQTK